tara:strand:- start:939 stop:1394 length:456 start_codon:yes stop_codon:yes gene_type:complete
MRLSKHFTLQELIKSSTAERRGIKNVPERAEIESLRLVCDNILEPVRQHFEVPMAPSSGYRCLELNRAIGSGDTSQHVKGQAVDFEIPGLANQVLANWIMENVDYDQLILEFYRQEDPNSGWVHCSYDNKEENRKESLRFDGKNWEKLKIA